MAKTLERRGFTVFYTVLVIFWLFSIPEAIAKSPKQAFEKGIIVLANSSMTNAIHEISEVFSRQENLSVSATFESPSELGRLITEGEPANVFITDDVIIMRDLQRLGVLNVFSLANIVSDNLVVAAPKGHFLEKKLAKEDSVDKKLEILSKSLLVVPDPEMDPAGVFAQQTFDKIKGWRNLEATMLRAPNTRSALYLIANGNNAGIIYKSDMKTDDRLEPLLEIPQKYYDRIVYQAAIVADLSSEDSDVDSKKFVEFLKSDKAKEIFAKHGFTAL